MDRNILTAAMAELDEDAVLAELKDLREDGSDAFEALEALRGGMDRVGALYEEGEYFVGDLIFAGEVMSEAVELLKPALAKAGGGECGGRVLLATVQGDMHDIGKNIVRSLLEAAGLEVLDLGTDTAPETVVETARSEGISVIALSGVLTLALDSMKATVAAFEAAGLRDRVRIIIGGAPVSEAACAAVGADEWAVSPQKTVDTCRKWLKEET